jgi:hypothetical protein
VESLVLEALILNELEESSFYKMVTLRGTEDFGGL